MNKSGSQLKRQSAKSATKSPGNLPAKTEHLDCALLITGLLAHDRGSDVLGQDRLMQETRQLMNGRKSKESHRRG